MNTGINRIRLEFKVYRNIIENKVVLRINRIRLEFKAVSVSAKSADAISVLIESDWNLKTFLNQYLIPALNVLIESDWNLKWTIS